MTTNTNQTSHPLRYYYLFGVNLSSDFPFVNPLLQREGYSDVEFTCVHSDPQNIEWKNYHLVYKSKTETKNGKSLYSIYQNGENYIFHFTGVCDFYLQNNKIIARVLDSTLDYLVEIRLLGEIFSIWLELHRIPTIHASSVVIKQSTAGFLSTNKGGKTSLAAAMIQKGFPLLTDDILPVEQRGNTFCCMPGYPAMRMWPDMAEYFLGYYKPLEIVHPLYTKRRIPIDPSIFGSFCGKKQPLKIIYIPDMRDFYTGIDIEEISKRDALFALMQNSFSPHVVEALGLQPYRMQFFAQLVQNIPIRRLTYPKGFKYLPQVTKVIIEDIEELFN